MQPFALPLICLPLLAGCALGTPPPESGPGPSELERSVVVDQPPASREAEGDATGTLADARGPLATTERGATASPVPASPVPMQNETFATERAATAAAALPQPAPVGEVVELPPASCGALTLSVAGGRADCAAEVLRAGRFESREFVALLVFDLRELPAEVEPLFAALELSGLDDAFAGPEARWLLRAVELPAVWSAEAASFAQLTAMPPSQPALAWRMTSPDFQAGGRAAFDIEGAGLALLAERMGRGRLALRIEGGGNAARSGPDLYGWHAAGEAGPRLRVAWLDRPETP